MKHFRTQIIVICLAALLVGLAAGAWMGSHRTPFAAAPRLPGPKPSATQSQVQCAENLPVDVLAGQVLMIGLPGNVLSTQASLFKQYHVGGAVLMSSPTNPYDGSIGQFKKAASSPNSTLLIATDEEGGTVQRFQSLGALPSPEEVASTLTTTQAEELIAQHGTKLKAVGVDMVLGPLADVAPERGESPLGSRVFSGDPKAVSAYANAYVRGWRAAGLLSTLKHFPGMGSATGNTDYQPATTPPLTSLEQRDFIPYKTLKGSDVAIMMGNQSVPGWFTGPASLSPVVNAYLRTTLGYTDNLIITDSLDAAAITSTSTLADAVVKAIGSGNDMAIIVAPDPDTITGAVNLDFISQSAAALESAVSTGALSKHQLAASVARKLTVQHLSVCSLLTSRSPK